MKDNNEPQLVSSGGGREILVGSAKLFLKLPSQVTENKLSITEYELPSGFPGPPAHKHKVFEHAWYVLEGELTVLIADKTSLLPKGSFIFIPKNTIHAFANTSTTEVKVLVVDTPGGFENYYEDLQAAFGPNKPLDPEQMRKIQLKYDTYPPDYVF